MTKFLPISFCVLFSIQESLGQCQYSFGSPIHTKQASYFCHQYVKAALIGNFIDMADGKPKPNVNESQFGTLYPNAIIAGDPDFIRVCSVNDAQAVCPSPNGDPGYHSAIKLNNGIFASTPDASSQSIFTHQSATAFTTACPQDVQYFAAIPYITITGASAVNQGTPVVTSRSPFAKVHRLAPTP